VDLPDGRATQERVRACATDPASVLGHADREPDFAPIEDATVTESDADLKPAQGFLNAVLLSVPFWGLLGVLTWFVLQ
jgi:hypothetical protein